MKLPRLSLLRRETMNPARRRAAKFVRACGAGFLPSLAGLHLLALAATAATNSPWSVTTDLTLKETFDSNVYLQDAEPNRTLVPQAVSPHQESLITSVTPKLSVAWKPSPQFSATAAYAPELTRYHSASSENYVAHRAQFGATAAVAGLTLDTANAFNVIEGSHTGLYFGAPGGAPAIGGIPIRERRDQFMYRGRLGAFVPAGKFFLRPIITGYYHDFQTVQRTDPGYENYVDRSEVGVGADVGWQATKTLRVFLGYRYGKEVQGRVVNSPYHHDATYDRPLAGLEGQPWPWLKLAVSAGPDLHKTTGNPAPGFDRNYNTLWGDASVTLLPTANDTLVLTWKQNTQPAFASASVYDDISYEAQYTRRLDAQWLVGGGFRLYVGDWLAPVMRDDWIYTASARLSYAPDKHWGAELAWSYDWVDSRVPNTAGREFTRHLVSLSVRRAF